MQITQSTGYPDHHAVALEYCTGSFAWKVRAPSLHATNRRKVNKIDSVSREKKQIKTTKNEGGGEQHQVKEAHQVKEKKRGGGGRLSLEL
jgi:hypothetical protein